MRHAIDYCDIFIFLEHGSGGFIKKIKYKFNLTKLGILSVVDTCNVCKYHTQSRDSGRSTNGVAFIEMSVIGKSGDRLVMLMQP